MPFTLAHPAAVLPLRGLRYLRSAPLILGAMIPDLPYYVPTDLGRRLIPETHTFAGSLSIDLVLGYASLVAVFVLRAPLTALLPARARWLCLNALAPFGRSREWAFAALAIIAGVWTHLLWDSFTHSEGWVVRRVEALSAPVTIGPYTTELCHVLQYVSSVLGLVVMAVWYARLPTPRPSAAAPGAARSAVGPVLLLVAAAGTLIGSVQAVEHFRRWHSFYWTIDVLLTRSLAWFAVLYLVAGTIVALEQAHERVSDSGK
jgi:Domain of unknown function (DUF4184)